MCLARLAMRVCRRPVLCRSCYDPGGLLSSVRAVSQSVGKKLDPFRKEIDSFFAESFFLLFFRKV